MIWAEVLGNWLLHLHNLHDDLEDDSDEEDYRFLYSYQRRYDRHGSPFASDAQDDSNSDDKKSGTYTPGRTLHLEPAFALSHGGAHFASPPSQKTKLTMPRKLTTRKAALSCLHRTGR